MKMHNFYIKILLKLKKSEEKAVIVLNVEIKHKKKHNCDFCLQ